MLSCREAKACIACSHVGMFSLKRQGNVYDLPVSFIENGRENRVALAARMKRPRLNDKVSQVAEH